jgi:hypothetical protein
VHEIARVLFSGVGVCVLMPVEGRGVVGAQERCEVWEVGRGGGG